jgi:hypothetical protein
MVLVSILLFTHGIDIQVTPHMQFKYHYLLSCSPNLYILSTDPSPFSKLKITFQKFSSFLSATIPNFVKTSRNHLSSTKPTISTDQEERGMDVNN